MLMKSGLNSPFTRKVQLCCAFLGPLPEERIPCTETGCFGVLLVRQVGGFQIGV